MKFRLFGRNTGLRVSEVALGGGTFGQAFPNGLGMEVPKEIFAAYADAGGNFLDSSSAYQGGESETLIGEMVKGIRNDFVIGTKYSVGVNRTEGYAAKGNSRKAMMAAIDDSLRRLQTDYVDIYWLHGHDAQTPMEEILRGMDDLVSAGKVLYVGFSNFPAWRLSRGALLAELRGYAPLTGIQIEYSAAERTAERDLIPMADSLGLGVTFWSPLSGGFLAGLPKPGLPHWTEIGRPTDQDRTAYQAVKEVADEVGIHSAQVAIAWMLDRYVNAPTAYIPILGAKNAEEIKGLLKWRDLGITPEQFAKISAAGKPNLGEPHEHNNLHADLLSGGDHYPPLYHPA